VVRRWVFLHRFFGIGRRASSSLSFHWVRWVSSFYHCMGSGSFMMEPVKHRGSPGTGSSMAPRPKGAKQSDARNTACCQRSERRGHCLCILRWYWAWRARIGLGMGSSMAPALSKAMRGTRHVDNGRSCVAAVFAFLVVLHCPKVAKKRAFYCLDALMSKLYSRLPRTPGVMAFPCSNIKARCLHSSPWSWMIGPP